MTTKPPAASEKVVDASAAPLGVIVRGSTYAFAGRILGVILQYLYNIGLGRFYGAGLTGLFAFGLSILHLAATIGRFGTNETVLRYVATYRSHNQPALVRGILIFSTLVSIIGGSIFAIIMYIYADVIAQWAAKPDVASIIRQFSFAVPLLAFIVVSAFALQGAKRLDKVVIVQEIGIPFAVLLALAIALLLGQTIERFVTLYVVSLFLVATVSALLLWSEFGELRHTVTAKFKRKAWLYYSMPITFIAIFQSTASWTDTLFLGLLRPAEEVGVYFVALRTALLITIVLAAFNAIFSPIAAELWGQKNIKELDKLFKVTTRWIVTFTLPMVIVLILLRQEIMAVFGASFAVGAHILFIMVLGRFINALTGPVARVLLMSGYQNIELVNTVWAAIGMVGGMVLVVPRYGMVGAAIVNSCFVALVNIVKLVQVKVVIDIQPYDKNYIKPFLSAVVAYLLSYWVYVGWGFPHFIVTILVIGIVTFGAYGLLLLLMGIPDDDRVLIEKVIARILPREQR